MMVLGLCLPLTGWAAESAAPGWQLTPFLGYSSSIDFEAMDEPAPTPHVGSLQGESSGNWGLFISREVDDPGMIVTVHRDGVDSTNSSGNG